ncbi:S49 family peptidase [Maricaulis maris]|uniref:Signal peptide peptidase SppA n=1 Tax=Maricaulis maris TaxID=74318 RepID=A0A495D1L4_9PROT|nr:S49 family peptidase [Maricaulis maris]RKQ95428.1 signal peptide peptidase SppA [Maricaulis maris]
MSKRRRLSMNASQGAIMLAMHAGFEPELGRLAKVNGWRYDPDQSPGLMDRAVDKMRRMVSGDARPVMPEASALDADLTWERAGYFAAGDVAVIPVQGVLARNGYYDYWDDCWVSGYADIGDAIVEARADERIAASVLVIDSPGGLSYGTDELSELIQANRMAAGGKPIVAFCHMAYSAAQQIAASCDACFAPRGAGLGSIGVRMGWFDWSGMMAEDKVKREEFLSGRFKDMGSPFREVTKEERAMFQAQIDSHAGFFFEAVATGRGISVDTVRSWEARTFTAGGEGDLDPIAAGLLDAVLTEDEAFQAARALAGLTPSSEAADGRVASHTDPAAATRKKEGSMSIEAEIAALRAKAAKGNTDAIAKLGSLGVSVKPPKSEGEDPKGTDPVDPEEEDDVDPEEEEDDVDPEAADDADDPNAADDEEEPKSKSAAGRKIGRIGVRDNKARLGSSLAADVAAGETSFKAALRTLRAAGAEASPFDKAMKGGRRGAPQAKPVDAPKSGDANRVLAKMNNRLGIKA